MDEKLEVSTQQLGELAAEIRDAISRLPLRSDVTEGEIGASADRLLSEFVRFLPSQDGLTLASVNRWQERVDHPKDGHDQLVNLRRELERLENALHHLNEPAQAALKFDAKDVELKALYRLLDRKKARVEQGIELLPGYNKKGRPGMRLEKKAAIEAGRQYQKLTGCKPTAPRNPYADHGAIYGPFPDFVRDLFQMPCILTGVTKTDYLADHAAKVIQKNPR